MRFSKTSPPPGFYHYLYLRTDGTPYYSGKGKGVRAWSNGHNVSVPSNPDYIVITHWGLTELWAFAMERWYIRWYGRKNIVYTDRPPGILRNLSDGGEGANGKDHLERWSKGGVNARLKIALEDTKIYTWYHKDGTIEVCNITTLRLKYGLSKLISRVPRGVDKSYKGWRITPTKITNQGSKNSRYISTIYTFTHKDGRIETSTRFELMKKYNLSSAHMASMMSGNRKSVGGWRVVIDK